VVVGPDHVAGTDDRGTSAVGVEDAALAHGLQPAVRRHVDRLRRLVGERREPRSLVARLREVGVDGDRRDVDVAVDRVAEQLRRVADEARQVAGDVHARVPGPTREHAEPAVAVGEHVLDVGEQPRTGAAAVEEGQPVPAREGRFDERAADELGAAEDEDLHTSSATPARRRSTSSSVL
jgi:hypothetical protein